MPAGGEAANRGRLILHCELVAPVRGPWQSHLEVSWRILEVQPQTWQQSRPQTTLASLLPTHSIEPRSSASVDKKSLLHFMYD